MKKHFLFITFLLVSAKYIKEVACLCPDALSTPPKFFTQSITLLSMKDQSTTASSAYFYIIKIPPNLRLVNQKDQLNVISSVSKIALNGFIDKMGYDLKLSVSEINVAIILRTLQLKWTDFRVTIAVFPQSQFPNLITGQLSNTNQQKRLSLSLDGNFQLASPTPSFQPTVLKILSFLSAVQILRKNANNFTYTLSLTEVADIAKKTISISVQYPQNNMVNFISVSYVLVLSVPVDLVSVFGDSFVWSEIKGESNERYVSTESFNQDLMVGLSEFNFELGPGAFQIDIKSSQSKQTTLEIKSQYIIKKLRVAVLSVIVSLNQQCNDCADKLVLNIGTTSKCVSSCDKGIKLTDKCLICNSLLGFKVSESSCVCLPPNITSSGQCLPPVPTRAVSTGDCIDPYTISLGNRLCGCIPGYSYKMNQNTRVNECTSICGAFSIQQGSVCVDCPFPQIQGSSYICITCTPKCKQCSNHYMCQTCLQGYQVNRFSGTCQDICGDGALTVEPKMSGNKCDDGNTISNDGCSSTCLIERGWNCVVNSIGRSICSKVSYKVSVQKNQFVSAGIYVLEVKIQPTFYQSQLTKVELCQIFMVSFANRLPYGTYFYQNQTKMNVLRMVSDYGGNMPIEGDTVTFKIILPNNLVYSESVIQSIQITRGASKRSRNMDF